MADGRFGRLVVLLVLPVLFGLLGMHALVVPAAAPPAATPMAGIAATGHETVEHGPPAAAGAADQWAPGSHDDHDGAAHLLHLCLAVLAAVGLVLLSAWSFLRRLPPPVSAPRSRQSAGGMPAQRPPPVPRRLAQLCVLRT